MTPDEVTDGHAEWRDVLIIQGGEYHAFARGFVDDAMSRFVRVV